MKFPKEFFEEETRDGFTIAPMMKRAWAAILEVLEGIDDLCRKEGIMYMSCGGTMLGAIRHKGFIPWDDDMDLLMLRDDYMRFIEAAKTKLPEGFVLAGPYAEEDRLWEAAQVVHSRIIADEEAFPLPKYMSRFHGFPYPRIGIDIFPYDFIDLDDPDMQDRLQTYYYAHFVMDNWDNYRNEGRLEKELKTVELKFGIKLDRTTDLRCKKQLVLAAENYISKTKHTKGCRVDNMQYLPYVGDMSRDEFEKWASSRLPAEWYESTVELPFEMIKMPMPVEYMKVVKAVFGENYMTPVMFAADHEYPFYKTQEAELQRMLSESGVTTSVEEFSRNWHIMNGGD